MAAIVLTDASVSIAGVALDNFVRSVTLNINVAEVEANTMDGTGWAKTLGGLKSWSATIEFEQGFGASGVDETLFNNLGSSVAFVGKTLGTAASDTNPSYSGNLIVTGTQPVNGAVGDLGTVSVTLPGTGALTRAEA